jgi:hypothetical protein
MDMGAEGEAALVKIYGGVSPSPQQAKLAGSPLPPLGLWASRLALCARVPLVFLLLFLLASGTS